MQDKLLSKSFRNKGQCQNKKESELVKNKQANAGAAFEQQQRKCLKAGGWLAV